MKGNSEKVTTKEVPIKEEPQDEKAGSVDQIKKKYGFGPSGPSSVSMQIFKFQFHHWIDSDLGTAIGFNTFSLTLKKKKEAAVICFCWLKLGHADIE